MHPRCSAAASGGALGPCWGPAALASPSCLSLEQPGVPEHPWPQRGLGLSSPSPSRLQIPAVHDFGLFMALIVSCCWLAVLFTMPAALGLWSLYLAPLEGSCRAR